MRRGLLRWAVMSVALALAVSAGLSGCRDAARDELPPGEHGGEAGAEKADGARTHEYWLAVGRTQDRAVREHTARSPAAVGQVGTALDEFAKAVEVLPAQGVDADALAAAREFAGAMRRLGVWVNQSVREVAAVPAAVHGMLSTTGAFKDRNDAAALRAAVEDAGAKCSNTRATLAARYGRDFPALGSDAPPKLRLPAALAEPSPAITFLRAREFTAHLNRETKVVVHKLALQRVERNDTQDELDRLEAGNKSGAELAACRQRLAEQRRACDALEQRLSALKDEKRSITDKLYALEPDWLWLCAASGGGEKPLDQSYLAKLREGCAALQKSLDTRSEKSP